MMCVVLILVGMAAGLLSGPVGFGGDIANNLIDLSN